MQAFIGITDYDWFSYLSEMQDLDEINFWQPSGSTQFRALQPGEPFLFKLHSPRNYIVGGGFFAYNTISPVSLAWEAFGVNNGAYTLKEMRGRIEKYRKSTPSHTEDYEIGCILLEQPFFFRKDEWISSPADWSPNIVRGKGYDTTTGVGKRVWEAVLLRLRAMHVPMIEEQIRRYGSPVLVTPRLGQGSFRIMVTDAYSRRCAVTNERTLPALDAVHIKPYVENGPHAVRNGVLFRSAGKIRIKSRHLKNRQSLRHFGHGTTPSDPVRKRLLSCDLSRQCPPGDLFLRSRPHRLPRSAGTLC
jgi:putative restriction endonuclease